MTAFAASLRRLARIAVSKARAVLRRPRAWLAAASPGLRCRPACAYCYEYDAVSKPCRTGRR